MTKEEVKAIRNKLPGKNGTMTKFEFAIALNVSIDSVISWENGRRNVSRISAEKIVGYAKRHGISIGDEKLPAKTIKQTLNDILGIGDK